ncbi:hypothetical protein [Geothrix sp. PMB-07]|uniref:hypothetical protein n=1 Tax=Geothrix sp. PMB-07 TaxID=3068640 RepID=UPI002741C6AD|nr:hypothetical protein [Geothrix sp. PMB-07]WLT29967.1 hypothetical protein Q9293_09595 [Geothrix sp. PMB-07]
MMSPLERRQTWNRIIGVERRAAPIHELDGRPLPDPTLLEDEEFLEARLHLDQGKRRAVIHLDDWNDPTRFD